MKFRKISFIIITFFFVIPKLRALTRAEIIDTADAYEEMRWTCYSSYGTIFIATNTYQGMAYSYGRWDDRATFIYRVETLQYPPVDSAGIDCSGFVSRCWQFPWKEGTYNLEFADTIAGHPIYTLSSFYDLEEGDILVDYSPMHHAMIVYYWDSWNKLIYVYDAAKQPPDGDQYRVDFRQYDSVYVNTCTPRSYFQPGIEEELTPIYAEDVYDISPNPFYPLTQIKYTTPRKSYVSLKAYDVGGRLVRTLIDEELNVGFYATVWDGKSESQASLGNGVYFIKLSTKDFCKTKKVIFLK